MRIGSLVTPTGGWDVELHSTRTYIQIVGELRAGDVGLVLKRNSHPKWGDPQVWVLSSSGSVGWLPEHHVREVG